MAKKKTAIEKVRRGVPTEVSEMPASWVAKHGPGTIAIPSGEELEERIRQIPHGATKTTTELRSEIAKAHGATLACPLVTGILWRLIGDAAEEERAAGVGDVVPYWRLVKEDGKMNEKLPGGIDQHAALLESEGHQILIKGKNKVLAR